MPSRGKGRRFSSSAMRVWMARSLWFQVARSTLHWLKMQTMVRLHAKLPRVLVPQWKTVSACIQPGSVAVGRSRAGRPDGGLRSRTADVRRDACGATAAAGPAWQGWHPARGSARSVLAQVRFPATAATA